jgi:hypothetical protein
MSGEMREPLDPSADSEEPAELQRRYAKRHVGAELV